MMNDIDHILYSKEMLEGIVADLGKQISEDYKDRKLLMVSILKGSVVFMADLMRHITIPCEIDFMATSSYGSSTSFSGTVRILKDLDRDIRDYDLLIVEDILDTGTTLMKLMEYMKAKKAKSVKLCALLNKYEKNMMVNKIHIDYEGAKIEDNFVVGYGLDYAEDYRNLPFIAILKPEVYSK